MPTSSETTIVRVSSTVPLSGRSAPNALNSASRPGREPEAGEQPEHGADARRAAGPRRRPSAGSAARGAERAQQPELARALGDGDRERVEDDEGADEQRDVGEDEQEGAQEAEVVVEVVSLLGRPAARRCARRRVARQHRARSCVASCARRHAGAAATSIWSKSPGLPVTRCASGSVSDRDARRRRTMSRRRTWRCRRSGSACAGAVAGDVDRRRRPSSARASAVAWSIATSSARRAAVALDVGERLEAARGATEATKRRRAAACRCGLPLLVEERRRREDRRRSALRDARARAATRGEHRRRRSAAACARRLAPSVVVRRDDDVDRPSRPSVKMLVERRLIVSVRM